MASGMSDPPPIKPPEFTSESTAEFAKRSQPPLRGIMVDPDFPPTREDAETALKFSLQESRTREHIRRTSGASKVFGQAPSTGEMINTMPAPDKNLNGGKYHEPSPPDPSTQQPPLYQIGDSNAEPIPKVVFWKPWTIAYQPCARDALLNGIAAGFVVGGAVFISGRPSFRASSWAVGASIMTSIPSFAYCKRQLRKEKEGMLAAVRIMEEKGEEKKKRIEAKRKEREERRRIKEEEEARRRWYRFWEGRGREG